MTGLACILCAPAEPSAGEQARLRLAEALDAMLARLSAPGHACATLVIPELGIAAGRTGPARLAAAEPGIAAGGQVTAILEGEIRGGELLAARLGLARDASGAAVVAALYAAEGSAGLERLAGHWSAVVVDRAARRTVVANDALGLRGLYHARTADGTHLIASTPASILAHPDAPRAVDPAGLAEMLAYQIGLGNRTLFAGIELLPPASLLTWEHARGVGEPTRRRYWALSADRPSPGDRADLERVRLLFNDVVAGTAGVEDGVTLALSGGADSRAILSALLVSGASFQTLTHAVEGATDAQIAADLSRKARAEHHFYLVRGEELARLMIEGAAMMGGQSASYDVHPVCFLEDIAAHTRVVLTGMGGAVYKVDAGAGPLSGQAEAGAAVDVSTFSAALVRSYNKWLSIDNDLPALLAPEWQVGAGQLPARSMAAVVEEIHSAVGGRGVSDRMFVEERMRKLLSKGDLVVRRDMETRHPLILPELFGEVFGLPHGVRANAGLMRYIITRNAPDLAAAPYERDGRSLRYLDTPFDRFRETMARRVRRYRRRLGMGTGFHHANSYQYGDWIRGPMRPVFASVLLDPHTLSRPFWRGETIRRWYEEHMAGQDRTAQLGTLFVLEVTLRYWLEG